MTRCRRCSGSIVQEPFSDPTGTGQRYVCLACGDGWDDYARPAHGGMTEAQREELQRPVRRGRKPGRKTG